MTIELDLMPPSSCPDVRNLDDDAAVETMVEWFQANFEDPAEGTPFDEGEYVFIWGGPYDAREELECAFSTAPEHVIKMAVERIEEDGWEWAPAQSRIQPVGEDEPESDDVSGEQ